MAAFKKRQENTENWYRMDNSAVIYPMSVTATTQSLFRLSAEMNDYIDKEHLKEAVEIALKRFPGFAVLIRSGVFHHFFDHNSNHPYIAEDNGVLFQKIDAVKNRFYLFRVTYYRKKIFIDFFHALCDAGAAMEFMKSVIYHYVRASGYEVTDSTGIKIAGEPIPKEELEDSFYTHYKDYKLFGGVIGKMAGKDALGLKGKRFRRIGYGLIEGYIDTSELVALSKKHNCTVTVLIAAIAMLSVAEIYAKGYQKRNLEVMIPIDLRRIFDSVTLKNFTTLAKCPINPNTTPRTVSAYVQRIKETLAKELDRDALQDKISLSSFLERNWFTKIMPLFLKTLIIKLSKRLSVNTKQTMIISNLGKITLPGNLPEFVNRLSFNTNVSRKVPVNMGIVSFGGITTVSFTRQLVNTKFEKRFFEILLREGIPGDSVRIASNFREEKTGGKFANLD